MPQLWGALVVAAWSAVATLAILWLLNLTIGLRVDKGEEIEDLDVALHGEQPHDS